MSPNRTLRVALAWTYALLLPLQGYAAISPCARTEPPAAVSQAHCAHETPGAHGLTATQGLTLAHHRATAHHVSCGDHCCCAAIALMPAGWMAPPAPAAHIPWVLFKATPMLALDRLDRPPRLT